MEYREAWAILMIEITLVLAAVASFALIESTATMMAFLVLAPTFRKRASHYHRKAFMIAFIIFSIIGMMIAIYARAAL